MPSPGPRADAPIVGIQVRATIGAGRRERPIGLSTATLHPESLEGCLHPIRGGHKKGHSDDVSLDVVSLSC